MEPSESLFLTQNKKGPGLSPPLVASELLRKFLATPWGDFQWPLPPPAPHPHPHARTTADQADTSSLMFYSGTILSRPWDDKFSF